MLHCRVEGSAVSTIRHPSLNGWRLVLCQPIDAEGADEGDPLLAVDNLGAGLHERVIVTTDGKSIRQRMGHDRSPVRFMIIGILDPVDSSQKNLQPA